MNQECFSTRLVWVFTHTKKEFTDTSRIWNVTKPEFEEETLHPYTLNPELFVHADSLLLESAKSKGVFT